MILTAKYTKYTKYNETHTKKLLYGETETGNYKKEGTKEGGEDYRGLSLTTWQNHVIMRSNCRRKTNGYSLIKD